MKIMACDLGDVWTGIALSDPLGLFAKPYTTVHTADLEEFLTSILTKESIAKIVIGLPTTLKGTESLQTKKVIAHKELLEKKYPHVSWVLWDERLTSKQAETLKKSRTKEEKIHAHAVAAALILQTYLNSIAR